MKGINSILTFFGRILLLFADIIDELDDVIARGNNIHDPGGVLHAFDLQIINRFTNFLDFKPKIIESLHRILLNCFRWYRKY